MVLKEWECKKHGCFESSHPICPMLGCRSDQVERVFLTAPGIKSEFNTRHEKGMQKLAAAYGQTDWKTARAGETSIKRPPGTELLWGDNIQKTLGRDINTLAAGANAPIAHPDGAVKPVASGMRLAATELGLTQHVRPPVGEMTVSRADGDMAKKVKAA